MALQTVDTELQSLIKTAIKPFQDFEEQPHFTNDELIMMALVLHERPMTSDSAMLWVFRTFNFYNDMVLKSFSADDISGLYYDSRDKTSGLASLKTDFIRSFHSAELAVVQNRAGPSEPPFWEISTRAARVLLEPVIGITRRPLQRLSFFTLPAELRTRIYNMVLSYSDNWLSPCGKVFSIYADIRRTPPGIRADYANYKLEGFTPAAADALSLLLANRQIYEEAMHTFYTLNRFECGSLGGLSNFLSRLSPSRRQHIRHVAFRYHANEHSKARKAFKLLLSITHLERITISVNERDIRNCFTGGRLDISKDEYDDVLAVPGIAELRMIRGLEKVKVYGDCPTLRPVLEKELVQPKEGGTKVTGKTGGKRKRKADTEEIGAKSAKTGKIAKAMK